MEKDLGWNVQKKIKSLGSNPYAKELLKLRKMNDNRPDSAFMLGEGGVPDFKDGLSENKARDIYMGILHIYGLHKYGSEIPANDENTSFAKAVRKLNICLGREGSQEVMEKRLRRICDANDSNQAFDHIFRIVRQMRKYNIGYDYGKLANDIYWLIYGREQTKRDICYRWYRDYYGKTD